MTVVENLRIRINKLQNKHDKKGLLRWLGYYDQALKYGNSILAKGLFMTITARLSESERKES